MASSRHIGSFFGAPPPEVVVPQAKIPWGNDSSISYVQTGRQALAAIAAHYETEGRNILVAPEYLCESMILGFNKSRWQLQTYKLSDNLTIDTEDLLTVVKDPYRTVVLSASYFGAEPSLQHSSALARLRNQGARVIEDETHRVLGKLEPIGDIAIASLRKVLPVADGAYVRGSFTIRPEIERSHVGWEAMDAAATGDRTRARELFLMANSTLTSWEHPPAYASNRTLEMLYKLDYEALRSRRRTNSESLRQMLDGLDGIEVITTADIPSHMVARVDQPHLVQKQLAQVGIFCPIHWPKPSRLGNSPWKEGLISLPVDHRYGLHDMTRLADQLLKAVRA